MGLSFEDKLRNYARIGLMYGLGFDQKVRPLYIDSYQTEDHGNFIPMLAEEAYKLGTAIVDVRYRYPELERAMFLYAPEDHKVHEPSWVTARAEEIVSSNGGRIALNGNGGLGVMDDVDPKYPSQFQSAYFKANEPYTTRRMQMLQPWNILDVPTTAWAAKLNINIEELWEFLFTVTGAAHADGVKYALGVSNALNRRCKLLNALQIRTLHFIGDGTDLKVGLSPMARWIGGRKQCEDGTWFGPNWPSFEVFTTPDWRLTEGRVRITMPSALQGPIVDDLTVEFREGRAVHFEAGQGAEAFRSLITHDTNACRLGEIALVGLDSPLSSYVEPHFCIMLDENKRCHMAFGQAYTAAIEGGSSASPEVLAEIGCNDSEVHHDMMISDETTSVFALDENGDQFAQLMQNGRWLDELA